MNVKAMALTGPGLVVTRVFACGNAACAASQWLVSRQPGAAEQWRVAETETARPWLVAARVPVCPLCGADLILVPSC